MANVESYEKPFVYYEDYSENKIPCCTLNMENGGIFSRNEGDGKNMFPNETGGVFEHLAKPLVMLDMGYLQPTGNAVHITSTLDGFQIIYSQEITAVDLDTNRMSGKDSLKIIDMRSNQVVYQKNYMSFTNVPITEPNTTYSFPARYLAVFPVFMYNIEHDSQSDNFNSIIGLLIIKGGSYSAVNLTDFERYCYQFVNKDNLNVTNSGDYNFCFPYKLLSNRRYAYLGGILQDGTNSNETMPPNFYDGNPVSLGGNSGTGGGNGDYNEKGDDIDIPDIPTYSALYSGFINVYAPTLSQLNELSTYMWSSDILDTIKKFYANPMDIILGLSIVPVLPQTTGLKNVVMGGISTGVNMYEVTQQYASIYCGEIQIKEFWGSALDYSPYTKIQIYLPYIGIRTLNTDDVMNKIVEVVYRIDVLTGSLTAFIKSGGSVLYQFSGNCANAIPISGRDFSQIIQSAISATVSLGTTVATGGANAPITAGTALSGVLTTAGNVCNSKTQVQKSGNMGGTSGLLGEQTPYLIIERPKQSMPIDYMKFVGYPSNITSVLSALTGYTEVESVHLEGITATDTEKAEILKLLQEGVIL